jgi:hypothetical protein
MVTHATPAAATAPKITHSAVPAAEVVVASFLATLPFLEDALAILDGLIRYGDIKYIGHRRCQRRESESASE